MAIKIGGYEADTHSFHHPSLGTDLAVIRDQSNRRAANGSTIIVHHHLSKEDCKDREHEAYEAKVPKQRKGE